MERVKGLLKSPKSTLLDLTMNPKKTEAERIKSKSAGVSTSTQIPEQKNETEALLKSKSILEQINPTEKRYLPESIPSSEPKRTKITPASTIASASSSSNTAASMSAFIITADQKYRKRRNDSLVPGEGIPELNEASSSLSSSDPVSKIGKFCHCNECYMEIAGNLFEIGTSGNDLQKSSSSASSSSSRSVVVPLSSKKKRGVSFLLPGSSSIRRSHQDKSFLSSKSFKDVSLTDFSFLEPSKLIRKITETTTVMTKENYIHDQARRKERFKRILGITE